MRPNGVNHVVAGHQVEDDFTEGKQEACRKRERRCMTGPERELGLRRQPFTEFVFTHNRRLLNSLMKFRSFPQALTLRISGVWSAKKNSSMAAHITNSMLASRFS